MASPGPWFVAVTVKVTTSPSKGVALFTLFVTAMSTPTGMLSDEGFEVTLPPVATCAEAVAVLVRRPVVGSTSAARITYVPVQVVEELNAPPGTRVVGRAHVTANPLSSWTVGLFSVTVPTFVTS